WLPPAARRPRSRRPGTPSSPSRPPARATRRRSATRTRPARAAPRPAPTRSPTAPPGTRSRPPAASRPAPASAPTTAAPPAATTTSAGDVRLVVATDRTSNGPTLVYPDPNGQGGAPTSTHWVLDSFSRDPWAGSSMIAAGDLVGREGGFTRQQADELKVLRHEQYTSALAEGRAFQRRYMVPVEVGSGRRAVTLEADEGIRPV